jgi:5'-nucleotidase
MASFVILEQMSEMNNHVLVDMDGVMADFDSAALANVPVEEIVQRRNFYVAHDYPIERRSIVEDAYNASDFFETLEPMPGLFEAWHAMLDNGYSPQVASAPLTSNPTAIEGKIKWLDRFMVPKFGPTVVEEAIIDKNKWMYGGLALIDDRPDVPKGPNGLHRAEWQHILFGWEHLDVVPMATAAFRLLSWNDTGTLINTLDSIREGRLLER